MGQQAGGDEMHIDQTNPEPVEPLALNKFQDFAFIQDFCPWKIGQQGQDLMPVCKVSARQLANHKGMA